MDNNQKQEHTKHNTNSTTKNTSIVSPMLWEDFNKEPTENLLEQSAQKNTISNTEKETSENPDVSSSEVSMQKNTTPSSAEITFIEVTSQKNQQENLFDTEEENLEHTKVIPSIEQIEQTDISIEATQKIETIPKQKGSFSEILQKIEKKQYTDDLGDRNAYLNTFESESFEEESEESYRLENESDFTENSLEESEAEPLEDLEEDEYYYDEETSKALYQSERKKIQKIFLIAFCIGLSVFLIGYMIMGTKQRKFLQQQAKIEAQKAAAAKKVDKRHMMVKTITTNRELSVHDIITNKQYMVKTNQETKFIDRTGKQASITRIESGDLISVVFAQDGQTAQEIRYSGNTWTAQEVSGLSVDAENKTVSITFVDGTEPKQYYYTDDKLFLYKDSEIAPEDIAPCDIVTMQGQNDKLWSIRVLEYHGTMTITNHQEIQNGFLSIDDGEKIPLNDFAELVVSEGPHKISVTGDNIESFEDTIFIVPSENFEYDLSKAQSKTGVMIVSANVYDFKLYINGVDTDGTKPIVLPLGEYDVVVLKNGYKQWNQKVTVTEPSVTVEVNMEEDIQEGIVSFHSVPEGASVIYNHTEIGVTPFEQKVRYGVYTVEILLEGYEPYSETIVVDKSALSTTSHLTQKQNTAEHMPLQ